MPHYSNRKPWDRLIYKKYGTGQYMSCITLMGKYGTDLLIKYGLGWYVTRHAKTSHLGRYWRNWDIYRGEFYSISPWIWHQNEWSYPKTSQLTHLKRQLPFSLQRQKFEPNVINDVNISIRYRSTTNSNRSHKIKALMKIISETCFLLNPSYIFLSNVFHISQLNCQNQITTTTNRKPGIHLGNVTDLNVMTQYPGYTRRLLWR